MGTRRALANQSLGKQLQLSTFPNRQPYFFQMPSIGPQQVTLKCRQDAITAEFNADTLVLPFTFFLCFRLSLLIHHQPPSTWEVSTFQ